MVVQARERAPRVRQEGTKDLDRQDDEKRCSLCVDSDQSPSLPNVTVQVPNFGEVSCADLHNFLPTLLELQDERCKLIQSVGTICGCPPPVVPSPSDPCHLCLSAGDQQVKEEWKNVPATYLGQTATCGLVELSLQNTIEATNQRCADAHDSLALTCGCEKDGTGVAPPDNPSLDGELEKCHPCWDGSDFPTPEKIVDANLLSKFNIDISNNSNLTCSTLFSFAQAIPASNDICPLYQIFIGGICGCPPIPNSCDFCPNDDKVPYPDRPFVPGGELTAPALPTCQETADMLSQVPAKGSPQVLSNSFDFEFFGGSRHLCQNIAWTSYTCGCDGGRRQYFGATSQTRRAALVWTSRGTGLVSFACSSLILWDVIKRSRNSRGSIAEHKKIYMGLVAGLSFCDLISSLSWIAATAPLNETFYFPYGSFDSDVYGAVGNDTTCKVQGFVVEFGMIGSTLFNTMLCLYYVLVVVRGRRGEGQMKNYSLFLRFTPLVAALAFAFGGIPHYKFSIFGCSIAPPQGGESWKTCATFLVGPLVFSLTATTMLTMILYCRVRKTMRKGQRWQFPTNGGSTQSGSEDIQQDWAQNSTNQSNLFGSFAAGNLRRLSGIVSRPKASKSELEVFWQCVCFLLAFYSSWVFFLAGLFTQRTWDLYGFWLVLVFFSPLQGFFNFLVYARPRILAYFRQRSSAPRWRVGRSAARDIGFLGSRERSAVPEISPHITKAPDCNEVNFSNGETKEDSNLVNTPVEEDPCP